MRRWRCVSDIAVSDGLLNMFVGELLMFLSMNESRDYWKLVLYAFATSYCFRCQCKTRSFDKAVVVYILFEVISRMGMAFCRELMCYMRCWVMHYVNIYCVKVGLRKKAIAS